MSSIFLKDFKTVKQRVEHLLENHENLRDSDKKLYISYLNVFHGLRSKLTPSAYEIVKDILLDSNTPSTETVRRTRQKIQEAGKHIGKFREERIIDSECVRKEIKNC